MNKKRILFVSGTRADYGKIKSLLKALESDDDFEVFIFVCGMHLLETFGSTYDEVIKDGYKHVYVAFGIPQTQNGSVNLGNTITCLSGYVENVKPDMIVVHGDRMDALAGAVVGALHNVLVGHIEGGELSGTIDESIRHAISKFAHIHFVCTYEAKKRLIQMGEEIERIHIIGSPDIDIMMSSSLPSESDAKKRYDISFDNYSIFMYHPVTTEFDTLDRNIKSIVQALIDSNKNYIVIYPNNDLGSEIILSEYRIISNNSHFRLFPSLRFEFFLTLLKHSDFIIGNSSAGIRESGVYGVPAIDIGTRQFGRYDIENVHNIQHVDENYSEIMTAINRYKDYSTASMPFGDGRSTQKFLGIIKSDAFWDYKIQKHFVDMD